VCGVAELSFITREHDLLEIICGSACGEYISTPRGDLGAESVAPPGTCAAPTPPARRKLGKWLNMYIGLYVFETFAFFLLRWIMALRPHSPGSELAAQQGVVSSLTVLCMALPSPASARPNMFRFETFAVSPLPIAPWVMARRPRSLGPELAARRVHTQGCV